MREPVFLPLVDFRSACWSAPKLLRSVSLKKTCVVLLLRLWCRVRELAREPLRECDRMGGVLGTDELRERYEVAGAWLPEK